MSIEIRKYFKSLFLRHNPVFVLFKKHKIFLYNNIFGISERKQNFIYRKEYRMKMEVIISKFA
jgi:hypothetical protein